MYQLEIAKKSGQFPRDRFLDHHNIVERKKTWQISSRSVSLESIFGLLRFERKKDGFFLSSLLFERFVDDRMIRLLEI